MSAPIRADLADVAPMYYPIVESTRFGSLGAMCKRMGWALSELQPFVRLAQINLSSHVVIDSLVLGDPADKVCAVLVMRPGGAVVLCCGLFGAMDADRAVIEALTKQFAESAEFKGKFIAIGEFRPNQKAVMQ